MTEAEYKNTEKIALELVDWLFTKTNSSHIILTVIMRSLCLFLAQTRKAFDQEMRSAIAFVKKEEGKAKP